MYKTKIGKIYFQMEKSQTKSKERVRERGEVFTAEREVKAMCDLVKDETERTCTAMPAMGTLPEK